MQLFETNPNKMSEDRVKKTDPDLTDATLIIDRLPIMWALIGKIDE